jgi:membrane fusion protein (multidrug efflux system)
MTKRIVIGVVGLALLVLVIVRVIQASADVEQAPDVDQIRQQSGIPVEVAAAQIGPLVVRREFTGTLRGIRSATIRARTEDEIVEIPVRVGQRVKTGMILIRQSSDGSMASVRQAEASWEQAQRNVERLRPLRESGAISEQDWDNAATGLAVAEANLEAARRSVVLTSPIDGIVTDILETRGTVPSPGDPLVRVSDLSRLQVLLQVSPGQAQELALGQPVRLPEYEMDGTVSRIAMQADPETRLLEVEITFAGQRNQSSPGRRAVPGALVSAEVEVGREDSALLVPRSAVRGGAVWVVNSEDVAHLRTVTIGLSGEDGVQILDGIAEGERVVVAGASLLSDGVRTRIVGG